LQLKKSELQGDAMKALKQIRLAMTAMMIAVLFMAPAAKAAEANQDPKIQGQDPKIQAPVATHKRVIVVSLEDRKLALVEDGKVIKTYPVAVGKPSTPSPVGTFTIERRVANPTYSHDGRVVPPGPNNPVGSRWMGLSIHGYGIHGTNAPNSIGKAASHGCIRMAKADLEELYPMVSEGDTVELVGQRNEETAELFGGDQVPNAGAQPAAQTELASAATTTAAPGPDETVSTSDQSPLAAVTGLFTNAGLTTAAAITLTGSL
jgi:lipoprotein-anchoring transpeptidase ErfK/SrfK